MNETTTTRCFSISLPSRGERSQCRTRRLAACLRTAQRNSQLDTPSRSLALTVLPLSCHGFIAPLFHQIARDWILFGLQPYALSFPWQPVSFAVEGISSQIVSVLKNHRYHDLFCHAITYEVYMFTCPIHSMTIICWNPQDILVRGPTTFGRCRSRLCGHIVWRMASAAAMAEAFFSLYCLVKNTLPQKVFFKFFKDLDMFFIYPKTAPNALWRCYYILQVSCFS